MVAFLKALRLRRVAGLAAAYALVLQSFFATSIVTQAAAHDPATYSGVFFVICSAADDGAAANETGAPVKPKTHCPICTVSASAAGVLPGDTLLPERLGPQEGPAGFVTAAACLTFHQSRSGLSRAPPANA